MLASAMMSNVIASIARYFIRKYVRKYLLIAFFPDTPREKKYRDNDERTYSTEWTKHGDDNLLRDHISIEAHTSECEPSQYLRFCKRLSQISRECEEEDNRIHYHRDHRKGDTEDERSRIR